MVITSNLQLIQQKTQSGGVLYKLYIDKTETYFAGQLCCSNGVNVAHYTRIPQFTAFVACTIIINKKGIKTKEKLKTKILTSIYARRTLI